jgi:hypothetical protein
MSSSGGRRCRLKTLEWFSTAISTEQLQLRKLVITPEPSSPSPRLNRSTLPTLKDTPGRAGLVTTTKTSSAIATLMATLHDTWNAMQQHGASGSSFTYLHAPLLWSAPSPSSEEDRPETTLSTCRAPPPPPPPLGFLSVRKELLEPREEE